MSRFSQSANNFYSTVSYARPATSNFKGARNRIMSTVQSLKPSHTIAFQRPQTGSIIRSASSSFRNTKGRLETLGEQLNMLFDSCKETRNDTRELQLQLDILKQDLSLRGIEPLKAQLTQQIKLLEKSIKIKERSDMLRFQALHQTCQALSRNTKEIRGKMAEVSARLLDVQNLLGFHGVRDKLKY